MKLKQLRMLLLLMAISPTFTLMSQVISFEYDQSGNRILREVIYLKTIDTENGDTSFYKSHQAEYLDNFIITISPNPNGGKFTVEVDNLNLKYHFEIYIHTLVGALIYENNNASNFNKIDISKYKNGTYILTLILDKERKNWKIIKQ